MARTFLSVVLTGAILGLVPISSGPLAGAHEGHDDGASAVTALTATHGAGAIEVSGTVSFGGQHPVVVSDDPPGDGPGMVPVGDENGVDEPGIDLLAASLSVPDPDSPELVVRWLLGKLPPGGIPEGTRVALPFQVGDEVFRVQAKFSNAVSGSTPGDPAGHVAAAGATFELQGDCTEDLQGTGFAGCDHLAWLDGAFDERTSTISARVPLGSSAAPEIDLGAVLRRTSAGTAELRDVLAGYQAVVAAEPMSDTASFGPPGIMNFAFPIPQKEVGLGIAPKGTDPAAVDFSAAADLAADDTFTGVVSTAGFDPGTFDVYARACFASNCGIRSLDGLEVVGTDAIATLALGGQPDRSFAFWRGPVIGSGTAHSLPHPFFGPGQVVAGCDNSPCFTYTLRVDSPGAERLRIAMDAPRRRDGYVTEVTAPDGQTFETSNGNAFNAEIFIEEPPVGDYEIVIRPFSARNGAFSMRAKLEAEIPSPRPNADGLLLPDLRPTPPYEMGFAAPVNPLNGPFLAPDDANPPARVGDASPVSCSVDDTALEQVVRCLRFSFGLANAGAGNFDIRWSGMGTFNPDPTQPTSGPLFQCVERADGSPPLARGAGRFEYHPVHLHTHYDDIVLLELHAVTDPEAGTLEQVGDGRKIGYSPADQSFARWFSFEQREQGTSSLAGNCVPGANARLGMSVGWGDVYRYQRSGNFVNFAANPDGLYVVRLLADPENNVLELDETNNISYTYVRVTGSAVQILEHGRGLSPWDPEREVIQPRYPRGVPW